MVAVTPVDVGAVVPAGALAAAVEAGLVSERRHPTLPLSIYTYTRACQYDGAWDAVTMRCRGLVVDDGGRVVAWPWPKFFNTGEHGQGRPWAPALPDERFEVFDKVDGSLAIVFHYAGAWRVASKGSFISEQAAWGQRWLDGCDTSGLRPGVTYLAEVLYPENRIVVNYDGRRDMVLLGGFDADGVELPLDELAADWAPVGGVVRSWPALPLSELLAASESNTLPDGEEVSGTAAEGWVIRFRSGVRAKVKLAEYVRLHKVLTGVTVRDLWRYAGMQRFRDRPAKTVAQAVGCPVEEVASLGDGPGPLELLLGQVPDEFDAWVRTVVADLEEQAEARELQIDAAFASLAHLTDDRRAFALAAQQVEDRMVRAALFMRLDGRSTDLHVWRSLRPEAADPFAQDEEG